MLRCGTDFTHSYTLLYCLILSLCLSYSLSHLYMYLTNQYPIPILPFSPSSRHQCLDIPAPFTLDLNNLFNVTGVIRDMVFLHGYTHPTLLVLHECNSNMPMPGCSGSEGACIATAISFTMHTPNNRTKAGNSSQRAQWCVFTARDLPFSASRLVACPEGGCLVFCENSVLMVDHDVSAHTTVNSFDTPRHLSEGGLGVTHLSSSLLPNKQPTPGSVSDIFTSKLRSYISASYHHSADTDNIEETKTESEVKEVDESVCEVLSSAQCAFVSPNVALLSTNRYVWLLVSVVCVLMCIYCI